MKHIIIASTKGGVGKTTVAVNIARKLSTRYKVGILDGDLTSPSIYKILFYTLFVNNFHNIFYMNI